MTDVRTPVVIVTGFLGSGKTTLVNRLLAQAPDSLVIVNEFGEVSVDHALMESTEERTVALPNGCICCRLRTDLEEALIGAAMRRRRGEIAGFDHVLIETSGLGDPGPVAQTLFADEALSRDYRLCKVITVVDATGAAGRQAAPALSAAQIAAADVVVLSKTDRSSSLAVEEARAEVGALNAATVCIEASFGEVPADLLAEVRHELPAARPAAHPSNLQTFVLHFPQPVSHRRLDHFLSVLVELCGEQLLRVKGAVRLESGQLVIVQGVRHVFDRHRPSSANLPSALIFITRGVRRADVEQLWQAMHTLGRA